MRNIKFRGLRVDGKGWVEGSYFHASGESEMLVDRLASNPQEWKYESMAFDYHLIVNFDPPGYQGWDFNNQTRFHRVIPESIGQFVNLPTKDKKGVFEGDILKCKSPNDGEGYITTFEVDLVHGISFGSMALNTDMVLYNYVLPIEIEVIGNVYENKDLIPAQTVKKQKK